MFRQDPGLCPICDAPSCGCTAGDSSSVVLLPQRDARIAETPAVPLVAELPAPEPEPFTTSTYDRTLHGPKRPRR
jgi:hypothetical protein